MTAADCDACDRDLFAAWVHTHGGAVRGFLLARVQSPETADDLSQEVFRRAWTARRRYREQGNARAYLLRIADRLARDHRRTRGQVNLDETGWQRHEPFSRAAEPSQAAVLAEEIRQLASVITQLSPLQQRVLLLRYYGQLSFAEIAEIIGCPLNTALSHARRGLETLRKLLMGKNHEK
jgi:RNA polymerase sigma-70 factor (ECF subfamily)